MLVGSPNPKSTERMSKTVGNCGRIILIEPNQTNVENHYAHISLHKLKNITIVPKAAYIKKGQLEYDILKGWWSDAGTFESLARVNELVLKEPPQ